MGHLGSIPGLGISPGEGNGYPLQYSCLENSMDCIVHWGLRVGHNWATSTFSGALGLCHSLGLLSGCGVQAAHCCGFSCCGAQALGHVGLSTYGTRVEMPCGMWNLPGTGVEPGLPCTDNWVLNHWAPREISGHIIFIVSPDATPTFLPLQSFPS